MKRRAGPLETVWLEVPEAALEPYEAALSSACATVGFFLADEDRGLWRVEGVRDVGEEDGALQTALSLAAAATGVAAELRREPTAAEGWLERTQAAFPDQRVGRRFLVRGTHSESGGRGRIVLTLDAGLAFGSGEHGSTRGCLRALEHAVRRRPRRILDLGTGSGILAMAAAKLLRRKVLATDIEPWSVRVARENAEANGVARLIRARLADGWRDPEVRAGAPYDLVLANILARPLCRMARDLAEHLAPGGTAILAGLLESQRNLVLAAHRRGGLALERTLHEGHWTTLVLRKPTLPGPSRAIAATGG
jgi:ribosomal protein L11 methyltransferase